MNSGSKQVLKFTNTSDRRRVCIFCKNETSFDKIDVIIVCYENIYTVATALFTSNKMPLFLLCNNEHFHPYFAIIFFKMKSASFSVVYTEQI